MLSPSMEACRRYAANNGNVLMRYQGGFWAKREWSGPRSDAAWFGTPTVEALVKRGVAEYTDWQEGRYGRFPIELTLITSGESK